MSDGKKYWAEREDEEYQEKRMKKFLAVSPNVKMQCIDEALANLKSIEESAPALKKWQHYRLDNAIEMLKKSLGEKP